MFHIVDLNLSDYDWLDTMLELDDLDEQEILLRNIRYRVHLISEKRALGLYHLRIGC